MTFSWSVTAYASDFINPVSYDRSSKGFIKVNFDKNIINFKKVSEGYQTEYEIKISDPDALEVKSYEQSELIKASNDIILACNMVLHRVVLNPAKIEVSALNVELLQEKPKITIDLENSAITIANTISMSESLHISVSTNESVDEGRIVDVFRYLQKLDRFNPKTYSDKIKTNLANACLEFENATFSTNKVAIFKHLYNTLELLTNLDGKELKHDQLDIEMAFLTKVKNTDCKAWRELYNRTKHIQRNSGDLAKIVFGIGNIDNFISEMRNPTSELLTSRLSKI